jgi:cysteinyl-tRNA synthetase
MAEKILGADFEIHSGGSDLVFPHHENEIAQSESAGRPFAHVWMHNGMVDTGGEKMSKSEGNIFQLKEALDRYGSEAVVAYLVSGHYRQPLAFGELPMEEAGARVERLRNFFREHPLDGVEPGEAASARLEAFKDALADDFNTPRAMAEVFELVGEARREDDAPGAATAAAAMLDLVGLGSVTAERVVEGRAAGTATLTGSADGQVIPTGLMNEREEALKKKDFARADEIRDQLAAEGWEVRDSAEGPRLVPKS